MTQIATGPRSPIDFRAVLDPSRTWILGLHDGDVPGRVELLADQVRHGMPSIDAGAGVVSGPQATALWAECACPGFCERDHPNE